MRDSGFDGILLTSPENVFYATGFPALPSSGNPILYALRNQLPFFAYVDRDGCISLICWGGAAAGVEYGVDETRTFADLNGAIQSLSDLLAVKLNRSSVLAVESSCPYTLCRLIGSWGLSESFQSADSLISNLRLIKSPLEIRLIEKSTQVVEQTVSELMAEIHVGIRRPALMQSAKYRMLKNGASGVGHVTISFGASNPEVEIDEQLQIGKLITLDLGAIVNGYASDNRRLMYSGEIPAGMRELHCTMCAIVDEVSLALRPERTFGDVYRLAMACYARHNLKPFIPNIGHTIGLQTEEVWLYGDADLKLQPGMVLNLEMYALYDTGELIGDEETYVIGADRTRRITTLPTEIRQIT